MEIKVVGEQTKIYGYIDEFLFPMIFYRDNPTFVFYPSQVNSKVISSLPEKDNWPPLIKQMFSISQGDANIQYDGRIIHFAGNINTLDYHLLIWIKKFENLLRELYWVNAKVFFESSYYFHDCYFEYKINKSEKNRLFSKNISPVKEWNFSTDLTEEDITFLVNMGKKV